MNKQPNNKPNIDVRALRKEMRERTEKENIKIFNETGLSSDALLAELKDEMASLLRRYNEIGRVPGGLHCLFRYETNLYELADDIERARRNSLEVQAEFKELKTEFDAFTNPK